MRIDEGKITVAVTGVGAIIGQGIVRSLRSANYRLRVLGIDRNPCSPGTYLCDVFEAKPNVSEDSEEYVDFWLRIVEKYGVALILPGLELDTHFFDRHRSSWQAAGIAIVLNTSNLIQWTQDKWLFGQVLKSIGYPMIPSARPETWRDALETLGAPPLLLKPLSSNGSRGILTLEDESDFNHWRAKLQTPWMLQRIVGSDDQEYTVGVFGLGNGNYIGPLIFRRQLSSAGNTLFAQVVNRHRVIEAAVVKLCKHFAPIGPTNLQFRLDGNIPYLLEINPRFSSSNSLRTAFGFNEAEMSLDFYIHNRIPDTPILREGMAWRYSEDLVIYAGYSV